MFTELLTRFLVDGKPGHISFQADGRSIRLDPDAVLFSRNSLNFATCTSKADMRASLVKPRSLEGVSDMVASCLSSRRQDDAVEDEKKDEKKRMPSLGIEPRIF